MTSVRVLSRTQRIVVNSPTSVSVVSAGPMGPPGVPGPEGPPGIDAETSVAVTMAAHVDSNEPHPVYDDMPDLTIIFENGLY